VYDTKYNTARAAVTAAARTAKAAVTAAARTAKAAITAAARTATAAALMRYVWHWVALGFNGSGGSN
jgi:hypothetical protein